MKSIEFKLKTRSFGVADPYCTFTYLLEKGEVLFLSNNDTTGKSGSRFEIGAGLTAKEAAAKIREWHNAILEYAKSTGGWWIDDFEKKFSKVLRHENSEIYIEESFHPLY